MPFEPGSVFKVITLAAALETTTLRPETIINCGNGAITLFGRTIHEARHGYGTIPMAMVLAKSSNIGAIQIGLRVGQENLYEYVRRFGFGQRTGITLPAESGGRVRKLSRLGHHLAGFGRHGPRDQHHHAATGAGLLGGRQRRPAGDARRSCCKKGGEPFQAEPPRRILRPETAITMRQMMEGVVVFPGGTGHRHARLDGYTSGGKTGSAQIYDYETKRYTHTYNGTFMGFAPVTNPAIVVVVTLNGTHGTAGYRGPGGGAGIQSGGAGGAARARRSQGPARGRRRRPNPPARTEEVDDLAIADLAPSRPSSSEDEEERGGGRPRPGPRSRISAARPCGRCCRSRRPGPARAGGWQRRGARAGAAPGAALRAGERVRVQFAR